MKSEIRAQFIAFKEAVDWLVGVKFQRELEVAKMCASTSCR